MAKRGPKRNPDSGNQLIMQAFFGKKEAANMPSFWRQWPEPYRRIYSNMWNNGLMIVRKPSKLAKKLHKADVTNGDWEP